MDYPALIPFGRRILAFAVLAALAGCQHGAPASEAGPAEQKADESQPAEPDDSVDWEKAAQTPEICDNEVDDDADGRVDCDDPECGPADGCEANWRTLSLGEGLGCALTESGGAWCWGEGEPRPDRLDVEQVVEDIALRGRQGCAVIEDQVKCWARRYSQSWETTELRELFGSQGVEQISAGPMVLCAKAASEARCWGAFQELQPGPLVIHYQDPSKFAQQEPRTHSFERELAEVTTGGYHACALDETGRAYCWGRNAYGQLGDSTTDDREQPVAVSTERRFRSLSAGMVHTCGVTTDDELLCWGGRKLEREPRKPGSERSAVAARRDADPEPYYKAQPEPAAVTTRTDYLSVSAGYDFNCAKTREGQLHCWGVNDRGQLGDGSTERSDEPVSVADDGTFSQVVAGSQFACALAEDAHIRCWGDSKKAQTGNMRLRFERQETTSPVLEKLGAIAQAELSSGEPCVLTTAGEVICLTNIAMLIGSGLPEELHRGRSRRSRGRKVTLIDGPIAGLAVGRRHICLWDEDGAAQCVGDNAYGQLGIGSDSLSSEHPTAVGDGLQFLQMAASRGHSCGVTRQKDVYCWGDDRLGQAGGGGTDIRWSPRRIALDGKAEQVVTGYAHSCAMGASGQLWCWGENTHGELGDGTTEGRDKAVAVAADTTFAQIASMGRHSCGLSRQGEVYCWGANADHQVSPAADASHSKPMKVSLPTMTEITVGYEHSCAANDDGQMYCWGGPFGREPHVVYSDDKLGGVSSGRHDLCLIEGDGGVACTSQGSWFRTTNHITKPVEVGF